jgi:hypothetical protein
MIDQSVRKENRNNNTKRNYCIQQDKQFVIERSSREDNNEMLNKRDYKTDDAERPDNVILGSSNKMRSITYGQQLYSHQHPHRYSQTQT